MPLLPIPEFKPDLTDLDGNSTQTLTNVLPRADGYGPFPDFSVYSSELANGNDSFTKVLLHMDGADAATTFTDSNTGGSAHTWTAAGNAQIDTVASKFGGAAGLFDGTGDFITTPDHADFTLGTSSFTVDLWFNCTAVSGAVRSIAGQRNVAGDVSSISFEIYRSAGDVIVAECASGGSLIGTCAGTTTFTDAVNTGWHHLAFVRSGSGFTLFIDGVSEATATSASSVNDSGEVLGVGVIGAYVTPLQWKGWLDEFRLSVGVARWTAAFTPPLTAYNISAACRGFFYARNADGTIAVFAATANRIYKLNNTNFVWVDVSKGLANYTTIPAADQWQFAQFNNTVIACQINTVPQAFDLAAGVTFADLGGSPPQARYVAIVGFFVVLSGLGSSTPYRVQWSDLGAITTWTSGVGFSDYQDLPDGGIVRGVAGGEYGIITQDASIRRMIYLPGSLTVFQIERISEEKGIFAPLSIARSGDRVFYLGTDGLKMVSPGTAPVSIGKERVDRFLLGTSGIVAGDIDSGNLQLCIGASDPRGSRVYLAYKSVAGMAGLFDTLLCYDWAIDRFTIIEMSGEYISSLARPGLTLEGLDSISTSIDALTFSLDDISTAAFAQLAGFNSAHKLGFYAGANIEATLVTSEQNGDGRRMRMKGFRPITDAASVYGSTSYREIASATPALTTETAMNAIGYVKQNVSTRYVKGKVRIPAGTVWTYIKGVEPDLAAEGRK